MAEPAQTSAWIAPERGERIAAKLLIAGNPGTGTGFALTAPISFWGGVDPKTSRIVDVRHPQHGKPIANTVLMLPETIGSSSASAVLLELIHAGIAPAAIILHQPDAILLLGVLVAREMGWAIPLAVQLDKTAFAKLDGVALKTGFSVQG